MANIRVVMMDLEGSEDTVRSAVLDALNRFEHKPVAAVAALPVAAHLALPAPETEVLGPRDAKGVRRGYGRAKKVIIKQNGKQHQTTPVEQVTAPASAREQSVDGLKGEIRDLLSKHPMSSGDIIRALRNRSPQTLYATLSVMRNEGLIETKEAEDTPEKLNYWKG